MVPTVLTVAGTDSSGGAGVYTDQQAILAAGGHTVCAVTAVTAQRYDGVTSIWPVPGEIVAAQLAAVFSDGAVQAVKSGMLASVAAVEALSVALRSRELPYVLDPVLMSSSGSPLLEPAALPRMVRDLFPCATLITPNAEEARRLSGVTIRDADDAAAAGRRLLGSGVAAVLVTGGHLARDRGTDVLISARGARRFRGEWFEGEPVRGTGCAYSSAIAARLAGGFSLEPAIEAARAWLAEAVRDAVPLANGQRVLQGMAGEPHGGYR